MNNDAPQSGAKKVLVVDSDGTVRLSARKALEAEGFIVDDVADGREALVAFKRTVPNLVLLEAKIREIDAFTLCREIRALPEGSDTAIVLMTDPDDGEALRKGYDAGATDFITKPIDKSILSHRSRYIIKASQAIEDLRNNEALLNSAQRIARLGSWEWNIQSDDFHGSTEFYHIFNIDPSLFNGTYRSFLGFIHPADRQQVRTVMDEAAASRRPFSIDHRILIAGGIERFVHLEAEVTTDEHGQPAGMTGTAQDITTRKQVEEQIRKLALYDGLTGLPNRFLFLDRLEQALRQAARNGTLLAVIFIDLDNFKDVNDSLGHKAGDVLLQEVAKRLLSAMRETDTVARLGGDEFTIFTQNITSVGSVYTIAQKIGHIFSEPFRLEGQDLFVSPSVGIALYPNDGRTGEELLKQADTAMYHVKEHGKGRYQLFSSEMQERADNRLSLRSELRRALEHNEFVLHYQPKFKTKSGALTGMEALVRWQHPEKGIIAPERFIPEMESIGLIVPLGEWILMEACRQNMEWLERGYPQVKVAVNLSAVQFQRGDVVNSIRTALEKSGMNPQMLEIEIRENILIEHADAIMGFTGNESDSSIAGTPWKSQGKTNPVLDILVEIRKMGVSIALDNFGTGYSSLGYLSTSPIDALKIDRRFIREIKGEEGNGIILAIIALSAKLGMKVIAEGVETDLQKLYLLMQGCREFQGYLVGRPVGAKEFERHFA